MCSSFSRPGKKKVKRAKWRWRGKNSSSTASLLSLLRSRFVLRRRGGKGGTKAARKKKKAPLLYIFIDQVAAKGEEKEGKA